MQIEVSLKFLYRIILSIMRLKSLRENYKNISYICILINIHFP